MNSILDTRRWVVVTIAIPLLLVALPFSASICAQETDATALYFAISNARLDEGLAPYRWSSLLDAAAQRHAEDMAANHFAGHIGSDGSSPQERIAEADYAAWPGQTAENVWSGVGTPQDAFAWWMGSAPPSSNILSPSYREIGIGVARDDQGVNYYVLTFGARPNVLPVFINDGAATTENPEVAIRLTNEEAQPQGQGTSFMGRAIEVRFSNEPDFGDAVWQDWEPLLDWTLPGEPGERAVYVQFRDAAGRTAPSQDSITLVGGVGILIPTPAPVETPVAAPPTATPQLAGTPPPTLTSPPTLAPIVTPAPGPSPLPLPSGSPFPTWTPLRSQLAEQAEAAGPTPLLTALCLLQIAAVAMGLYLALRRERA